MSSSDTDSAGAPPAKTALAVPGLTDGYVRYALWMLLIIYTLNFVDRQIVAILAGPIKADLGLSDTQLGLLVGIAFAFFYTLLGIPIARVAERGNRPLIISTAVVVWSGFTALSGLAQNFAQMFLARIGVGVGEAGCTPPAHSLISDYVPPERRASAIAFYSLGVPVGTAVGFVVGAQIAAHFGWRAAFFAVGVPGVILGLIALFTLKEPRRLGIVPEPASGAAAPGFGEALKVLGRRKSYLYAVGAATTISFLGYGHAGFLPQFLARTHEMKLADIGTSMALMTFVAGVLGTLIGGAAADRAAKADTRAYMTIPAIAFVAGAPFFYFAMLTDNLVLCLVALGMPTLLNSVWYGPVYAAVQGLAPVRMRATAVALMLFVVNMVGLGLGPTVIGALSDMLAQRFFVAPAGMTGEFAVLCAKGAATAGEAACKVAVAEGLRWSLIWSAAIGLVALFCFLMARRTIAQDLQASADEAKAAA